MKKYRVAPGRQSEVVHEHPERTASAVSGSGMDFDIVFQVWPNRESMARTIRMQERRERKAGDWKCGEAR